MRNSTQIANRSAPQRQAVAEEVVINFHFPLDDLLAAVRVFKHEAGIRGQVLQSYNALGTGYPFEYGPAPRIHVPGSFPT